MKNLVGVFLLMFGLVSCKGSGLGTGDDSQNAFYNQYQSGACGLEVISDYNSAVMKCKYMFDREDIQECQSKLVQFKSKYPGINCTAQRGYGLDEEIFTINGAHLDELLEEVTNL